MTNKTYFRVKGGSANKYIRRDNRHITQDDLSKPASVVTPDKNKDGLRIHYRKFLGIRRKGFL